MPLLRDFALNGPAIKIRKEAIYRLSRRDHKETLEILETVVFKDEEIAVQKEALYRISQVKTSKSLPLLKKIALSHSILSLRKEAIYRLGKKKHPEANKVLVELLQGVKLKFDTPKD